jgi:putative ABC transport system substrate-binding protein
VVVRAQQPERVRRIGVLMNTTADPDQQANVATFRQALQQLGWTDGRNVRIDVRWAGGQASEIRRHANELVALAPDVILATGNAGMPPLLQATHTVPIVFNNVADPVGAGYVDSMARPDGNATGFIQFDYTLSGKWLELLKQIAPHVTRVAILRDAALAAGTGQFAVIQSVAPSVGVEVSAIGVHDAGEIERKISKFANSPNGGLILTSSAWAVVHQGLIIALAARHNYGGLVSYGYDVFAQFSGAAAYVDRILKGEKPADLPVQAPNKYELVINLKTAKALGLTIPPSVLARADEVIE